MKTKIAIFASGQGSNARQMIEYFRAHPSIEVDCIVCNRMQAGVFDHARQLQVDAFYFPKARMESGEEILKLLKERSIDWIVLAGFLLKIPDGMIGEYQGRMVNIHPSLLPKFGGAGMYGDRVHEAVLEAKEKKSGISIHWVDEGYDTGSIINQFECELEEEESLRSLKEKIRRLEHEHLPKVVESLILDSREG